jgi:hypothetical protein
MQEATMAKLKTVYETPEEIPDGFAELYAERGGKMELVGIEGVKTQSDIDRIQGALVKERTEHKAAKDALTKFSGIDPDVIHTQLAELDETKAKLEALAPGGKLDETKLEPVIEARVKRAVGPVERDLNVAKRTIDDLNKKLVEKDTEVGTLKGTLTTSAIERSIRDAAMGSKMVSTAIEDAVLQANRVFEVTESGDVVTKDGVGVTPGIKAVDWLKDMQEKRPHWWPQSQGGGAGLGGRGGIPNRADNPWSKEGWNLTKQGQLVRSDANKAAEIAKSVGSFVGATHPAAAA